MLRETSEQSESITNKISYSLLIFPFVTLEIVGNIFKIFNNELVQDYQFSNKSDYFKN